MFFAGQGQIKHFLKQEHKALEQRYRFTKVFLGMQEEKAFSCLQGFVPENNIALVVNLAKENKTGYLIETPKDTAEIPTLIKNPKWINIINPVFKLMNTLPGYEEWDISFFFLVFFSMFFAMLIGDAGYGALFIISTFFIQQKFRKMPQEPLYLMYVLGFCTVIWGAITGTWFGVEKIAQAPVFNLLVVNKINSFIDTNQNFMIYICFIIGIAHLTIAHLLKAARIINSIKVFSEIGWILIIWGLFFTAGTLVINNPFPSLALYMLVAGALFVLFFTNPQKNILKSALSGLANLPLSIISTFSDVVSYLRLFAVGYASLILATSFNDMAMQAGFGGFFSSLLAALILFIGHLLNIVLGFMAVIVHGVRLNMLEFAGQLGMEWTGKKYAPFHEEE